MTLPRPAPIAALQGDPLFHKLRQDPRFSAMLRKAQLVE
jgi:hypothetical protein